MILFLFFFFFKQKTAYEMRISDWSSDVCSSDLRPIALRQRSDARGQAGFRESKGTNTERKISCRWSCFGALISERRARAVSPGLAQSPKIGRASCRERVCQSV